MGLPPLQLPVSNITKPVHLTNLCVALFTTHGLLQLKKKKKVLQRKNAKLWTFILFVGVQRCGIPCPVYFFWFPFFSSAYLYYVCFNIL